MLSLGPHASFIVAAYAVTFVGITALVIATVGDDLKQRRRLAELERQGIRRRSAEKAPATRKPASKTRARAAEPAKSTTLSAKRAALRKPAAKRSRPKKTPS